MKNKKIQMSVLQYLYECYFAGGEKPKAAEEVELYDPCKLTVPANLTGDLQGTKDMRTLRANLNILLDRELISAQWYTGYFHDVEITSNGIEFYDFESQSWIKKVFAAILSPEKAADIFYNTLTPILGAIVGVIVGFLLSTCNNSAFPSQLP